MCPSLRARPSWTERDTELTDPPPSFLLLQMADFFRFSVKFVEQLYTQQPAENSPGVWKSVHSAHGTVQTSRAELQADLASSSVSRLSLQPN